MDRKVLFARIGWMTFYAGARDERPIGGGSYNQDRIGSELFNFRPVKGLLYGFARGGSRNAFNLTRIAPHVGNAEQLEHVLVIFVAKHPKGGQRVVGWYKDATVYRVGRNHPIQPSYKQRVAYGIKAPSKDACLLPTHWRTELVPGKKGGMGQSNVCYAGRDGKVTLKPWMTRILKYIDGYEGPNLLQDKSAEAEKTDAMESVIETSHGFETNPRIRRAIEDFSVQTAKRHFERLGFKVEIKGKPYDLRCSKGRQTKYVEVKGTRTDGSAVALTRNEVAFLRKHQRSAAMFLLHHVEVKAGKMPKASGGVMRLIEPWNPDCGTLKPVTFFLHFRQKHKA